MTANTDDELKDVIKVNPSQQAAVIYNDGRKGAITMSYKAMLDKSAQFTKELKDMICLFDGNISSNVTDNINNNNDNNTTTSKNNNNNSNNKNNNNNNNNKNNNNNSNVDKRITTQKLIISISSRVTVELPMIIYSIVQTSLFVFMPLSLQSPCSRLTNQIQKCKLKWMVVPKCEVQTLKTQMAEKDISIRTHSFRCLTEYVLVELVGIPGQASLPRELVYIVQSSGTTGEPKIIYVTKDCIIPNILDLRSIFAMRPSDVVLLSSSITFDASLVQMFLSWSAHASLLITPQELIYSPLAFVKVLEGVTVLQCTPSLLQTLGFDLLTRSIFTEATRLRVLALGGERFLAKNKFLNLTKRAKIATKFYNIYGTSEVSSWASIHCVSDEDLMERNDDNNKQSSSRNSDWLTSSPGNSDWLPIGHPLSNTVVEVRNENGEVVVKGFGEVFIGGDKRLCYLNDETMETAQMLRPTGDIAYVGSKNSNRSSNDNIRNSSSNNKNKNKNRNNSSAQIFICGRKGSDVKRNGQLVSLSSLTNVGNAIDAVDSCVCVFDQEIIYVFLQVTAQYNCKEIERTFVETIHLKLSRSHIPDRIIFVKNIPVTSHGKVDKHKLLAEFRGTNFANLVECCFKDYVRECWELALNTRVIKSTAATAESTFNGSGGDSFAAIFFLNRMLQYFPPHQIGEFSYERLFTKVLTSTLTEVQTFLEQEFMNCQLSRKLTSDKTGSSDNVEVHQSAANILSKQDGNQRQLRQNSQKQSATSGCACLGIPKVICREQNCNQRQPRNQNNDQTPNGTSRCACPDLENVVCHRDTYQPRNTCNHFVAYQKQNSTSKCACPNFQYTPSYSLNRKRTSVRMRQQQETEILEKWKYNLGKCVDSSPLIVFSTDFPSGVVYIGCHSMVFAAISLVDGMKVWDQVVSDRIESTAVISEDGNSVIFGCYDGELYSLDSKTGEVDWSYKTNDAIKSSSVVFENIVIFASHDKHVYAIDTQARKLLWKYHSGSACSTSLLLDRLRNCVYVSLLSGSILSLVVLTGQLLWQLNIGKPIFSSPCFCKDSIVFGSVDETVYSVDFEGRIKWMFEADAPIFSPPICVVAQQEIEDSFHLIVFGCNDHHVYCLTEEGILVWKHSTSSKVVASVAVYCNGVSNTEKGTVLLDTCQKRKIDGTSKCSKITSSANDSIGSHNGIISSEADLIGSHRELSCARGVYIVFTGTDGTIGLLDINERGRFVASYMCEGEVFSSPVVVGGFIIVGCRDDNVYCMQIHPE